MAAEGAAVTKAQQQLAQEQLSAITSLSKIIHHDAMAIRLEVPVGRSYLMNLAKAASSGLKISTGQCLAASC